MLGVGGWVHVCGKAGRWGPRRLPSWGSTNASAVTGSSCVSRNAEWGSWPPWTSAQHPLGFQPQALEEVGPSVLCQADSLELPLSWPRDPPSQVVCSANPPATPTCRNKKMTIAARLASLSRGLHEMSLLSLLNPWGKETEAFRRFQVCPVREQGGNKVPQIHCGTAPCPRPHASPLALSISSQSQVITQLMITEAWHPTTGDQ